MSNTAQPARAEPLVLEVREGTIAVLTMNRPDRLNAINTELGAALVQAFDRIAKDSSIRVVVLTGAGRAFCSGGDLAAIRAARDRGATRELEPLLRAGHEMVLRMRTMTQPVIAAVNGPAAGAGMNIALAADIRIASEEASFGQNFAKIGLFPDYGGAYLLTQLVGPARAAEMFYTGEMIDAQSALRLGIVNKVVPTSELAGEAHKLAEAIAQGPPISIRAVKQALFASDHETLERALRLEAKQQLECFLSEDCGEGIRAFFEKRRPKFQGR